jgi:hypothetical protein
MGKVVSFQEGIGWLIGAFDNIRGVRRHQMTEDCLLNTGEERLQSFDEARIVERGVIASHLDSTLVIVNAQMKRLHTRHSAVTMIARPAEVRSILGSAPLLGEDMFEDKGPQMVFECGLDIRERFPTCWAPGEPTLVEDARQFESALGFQILQMKQRIGFVHVWRDGFGNDAFLVMMRSISPVRSSWVSGKMTGSTAIVEVCS